PIGIGNLVILLKVPFLRSKSTNTTFFFKKVILTPKLTTEKVLPAPTLNEVKVTTFCFLSPEDIKLKLVLKILNASVTSSTPCSLITISLLAVFISVEKGISAKKGTLTASSISLRFLTLVFNNNINNNIAAGTAIPIATPIATFFNLLG